MACHHMESVDRLFACNAPQCSSNSNYKGNVRAHAMKIHGATSENAYHFLRKNERNFLLMKEKKKLCFP